MLIEEQIRIRKERALKEKFKIKKTGKERVFADYAVKSLGSGRAYRVAVRGFNAGDNYCSCPDYASNTIGTCKHIEAVLNRIRKNVPKKYRAGKEDKLCEIYLSYGKQLDVKIKLPANASDEIISIKSKYFDEGNILKKERFSEFADLMKDVERLDDNIMVYSDTIDFVERQLENEYDLKEEQLMVKEL